MNQQEQETISFALSLYRDKIKNGMKLTSSNGLRVVDSDLNWRELEMRRVNELERKLCMCGPIKRSRR